MINKTEINRGMTDEMNMNNEMEETTENGYEIVMKVPERTTAFTRIWNGTKVIGNILFFVLFFASLAFWTFIGENNVVSGDSMNSTMADGERLITLNDTSNIAHGSIIVAEPEEIDGKRIVKRVIGMAGDTVGFKDGKVFLNGEELDEAYINEVDELVLDGEVTLGEDEVWVMGDNRNHSSDSRHHGPVSMDDVTGVVSYRYFPLNRAGLIE